jgi:hypothetical protein
MKHMRKAKMQWHGDPKNLNKEEIYKDKSFFWNQKVNDIEKVRSMAAQETKLFTIQNEVNENIAEAAKSHEAMMEALGYQVLWSHPYLPYHPQVLEPGQIGTMEPGEAEESGKQQVLINVFNESGLVEQRQVVLGEAAHLGDMAEEVSGAAAGQTPPGGVRDGRGGRLDGGAEPEGGRPGAGGGGRRAPVCRGGGQGGGRAVDSVQRVPTTSRVVAHDATM